MSESPEKRDEKGYIEFDMRSKNKEVTITLSSDEEKEIILNVLFQRLSTDTNYEVGGLFKEEEGFKHIKTLREVTKKLAIDLRKDKIWHPEDWLRLGIVDFIPEKILKKWATEKLNHKPDPFEQIFRQKAKYFYKQKIKEKK